MNALESRLEAIHSLRRLVDELLARSGLIAGPIWRVADRDAVEIHLAVPATNARARIEVDMAAIYRADPAELATIARREIFDARRRVAEYLRHLADQMGPPT